MSRGKSDQVRSLKWIVGEESIRPEDADQCHSDQGWDKAPANEQNAPETSTSEQPSDTKEQRQNQKEIQLLTDERNQPADRAARQMVDHGGEG